MPGQHLVDEGLIADATATRFLAECLQHADVDADRDELPSGVAEGRPAYGVSQALMEQAEAAGT